MANPFTFILSLWGWKSLPENKVIASGIIWILLKWRAVCASDFPHYFANSDTVNTGILSLGDTDELDCELMEESDVSCWLLHMCVVESTERLLPLSCGHIRG